MCLFQLWLISSLTFWPKTKQVKFIQVAVNQPFFRGRRFSGTQLQTFDVSKHFVAGSRFPPTHTAVHLSDSGQPPGEKREGLYSPAANRTHYIVSMVTGSTLHRQRTLPSPQPGRLLLSPNLLCFLLAYFFHRLLFSSPVMEHWDVSSFVCLLMRWPEPERTEWEERDV